MTTITNEFTKLLAAKLTEVETAKDPRRLTPYINTIANQLQLCMDSGYKFRYDARGGKCPKNAGDRSCSYFILNTMIGNTVVQCGRTKCAASSREHVWFATVEIAETDHEKCRALADVLNAIGFEPRGLVTIFLLQ